MVRPSFANSMAGSFSALRRLQVLAAPARRIVELPRLPAMYDDDEQCHNHSGPEGRGLQRFDDQAKHQNRNRCRYEQHHVERKRRLWQDRFVRQPLINTSPLRLRERLLLLPTHNDLHASVPRKDAVQRAHFEMTITWQLL